MNFARLLFPLVVTAQLTSCSNVQNSFTQALETTKNSLSGSQGKVQLTKADPSRFLPANTKAERIGKPLVAKKKRPQILAKNDTASPLKGTRNKPASLPELELPTLDGEATDTYLGILPPLYDEGGATWIDVDGETPELPPLPTPEEVLAEEELGEKPVEAS